MGKCKVIRKSMSLRTIVVALSVMMTANLTYANNLITTQDELSSKQVNWINKHRKTKDVGKEFQFVYFREQSGHLWSVSINEYRKSKYSATQNLQGFFEEVINTRKAKETKELVEVLSNASDMMFELIEDGMSEKSAITIVSHTYPRFSMNNNKPVVQSDKYPMVSITIQ